MTVVFIIMLVLSIVNSAIAFKLLMTKQVQAPAPVKEIERVKAICDCDHPMSMHTDEKGCTQQLFRLDGQITNKSYTCYCKRYIGPLPLTQYFDDQIKELT